MDYGSELITADELLQAAGRSRARRSFCHYRIALQLLADGDRAGARNHLHQCVATNFFPAAAGSWAKAFLARLEQDPAWPPWIPPKK